MNKTNDNQVKQPSEPRRRRRLTAEYKLKVLQEADLCRNQPGKLGELLRREGLYSSTLSDWRKQRDMGGVSALSKTRGPKVKTSAETLKNQKLEQENRRLQERLRQANLIIEAQKKISEILRGAMGEQEEGSL